jgi:hypothetical protein
MLRILCFAEAAADARTGRGLADRVLAQEGPEWVEPGLLPALRVWTGLEATAEFSKWTELKGSPRPRGRPRYIGHASDGPKGSDYAMAVKALIEAESLAASGGDRLAVVMLRDCDATPDRREGLRQAAREPRFAALNPVVGIADKMRESWVLSGFSPATAAERAALAALKDALGLDPTVEPERLRAAAHSEPRHPKRALAELTGSDAAREARCWLDTSLAELRARGGRNGLAAFLDDTRDRLAPLLG